jgi:hypothetical protein
MMEERLAELEEERRGEASPVQPQRSQSSSEGEDYEEDEEDEEEEEGSGEDDSLSEMTDTSLHHALQPPSAPVEQAQASPKSSSGADQKPPRSWGELRAEVKAKAANRVRHSQAFSAKGGVPKPGADEPEKKKTKKMSPEAVTASLRGRISARQKEATEEKKPAPAAEEEANVVEEEDTEVMRLKSELAALRGSNRDWHTDVVHPQLDLSEGTDAAGTGYACDFCDQVFISHDAAASHERRCEVQGQQARQALSARAAPPSLPVTTPSMGTPGYDFSKVLDLDGRDPSMIEMAAAGSIAHQGYTGESEEALEAKVEALEQQLERVKHGLDVNTRHGGPSLDLGSDAVSSPIYVDESTGFHFRYRYLDLPPLELAALERLDVDNSGDVSLSEVLQAESENRTLGLQIVMLVCLILFLVGAVFLVSFAAATMAQTTESVNGYLTARGAMDNGEILKTAEAEESVPVALSPLLSPMDIGRVNEVVVSNLGYFDEQNKYQNCKSCPKQIVMQVDVAMKFNDTLAQFTRTGGMEIIIDKGFITVSKVPFQNATQIYVACGSATCSSIRISGINTKALSARAVTLGYGNLGGRRGMGKYLTGKDPLFGKGKNLFNLDKFCSGGHTFGMCLVCNCKGDKCEGPNQDAAKANTVMKSVADLAEEAGVKGVNKGVEWMEGPAGLALKEGAKQFAVAAARAASEVGGIALDTAGNVANAMGSASGSGSPSPPSGSGGGSTRL